MKRIVLFLSLSISGLALQAQTFIQGRVLIPENGKNVPAIAADVFWKDGVTGTQTNEEGLFRLQREEGKDFLIIGYVGYRSDTLNVRDRGDFEIVLQASDALDEVVVARRVKSTRIDYMSSIKVENISEKELQKAACCNLAESFETSPAVDVSFSDAISGTRQIRMLGLSGRYSQVTVENLPGLRGVSSVIGLEYIPGTWIESVQLNKGTGSVANGYESMTGQINVQLRTPGETDRIFVNGYVNQGGRLELNLHGTQKIGDKWSTATLAHGKYNIQENDRNSDGFMDMPLSKDIYVMHRWKYFSEYLRFQFGVTGISHESKGGQLQEGTIPPGGWWLFNTSVNRLDGFYKMGILSKSREGRSAAVMLKSTLTDQSSTFGTKSYDPWEFSLFGNAVFMDYMKNTNHLIKTGLQYHRDDVRETVLDTTYERVESVPGIYGEYTFKQGDKFSSVLGLRGDYHNLYGAFVTPRLHMRYEIAENWIYRLSLGRGLRTPNIFADNPRIFASNRDIIIHSKDNDLPYGLRPEIAWNLGMSLVTTFKLDYREGQVAVDVYRTQFTDQIVMDMDQNPQEVNIYALDGVSYSNSIQAQLDYELAKRLDMRLAYRWYDVRQDYSWGTDVQVPFLARQRAFANLAYETKSDWKFDATFNWNGEQRLPSTSENPEDYRMPSSSVDFSTVNAQVTKVFHFGLELYAGMENIFDQRQERAILSADAPNSEFFDASLVWGPIFGRNTYFGLRYRIASEKE